MTNTDQIDPLAVSIPKTQALLGGVSRSSVYRDIKRGGLEMVKVGNRTLVTMSSIRRRVSGKVAAHG